MSRNAVFRTALVLFLIAASAAPGVQAQAHFQECAGATGHNATVIIPGTLATDFGDESLAEGDEIAVLTSTGLCAGVVTFGGTSTSLTVWGDDPMTDAVDGFEGGDSLRFVIWDASRREEHASIHAEYASNQPFLSTDGKYKGDAIYSVTSLTTSALDLGATTEHPLTFELAANYPNPFNPSTSIRYSLPERAQVMLDVVNALGRRVQVLVSEVQAAGTYDIRFDGAGLPSGTYLYRLIAGRDTQVRQMVLLK